MIRRPIGKSRPLNAIGLGCMGMSFAYGPAMDEGDAVSLLHKAIDLGVDHFDTASSPSSAAWRKSANRSPRPNRATGLHLNFFPPG